MAKKHFVVENRGYITRTVSARSLSEARELAEGSANIGDVAIKAFNVAITDIKDWMMDQEFDDSERERLVALLRREVSAVAKKLEDVAGR